MVGKWNETDKIMIDKKEVGAMDDFCYLGSLIVEDSSCDDKEVEICIWKAHVAFGLLEKMWKNNACSLKTHPYC